LVAAAERLQPRSFGRDDRAAGIPGASALPEGAMLWLYDLPTSAMVTLFSVIFVGFTWLGAIFIRPFLRLLLRSQPGLNDIVGSGISPIMWYVVAIGSLITVVMVWLFDSRLSTQFILGGALAFFLGTVVSLIVAMDRPFNGDVSIGPDAYRAIYVRMTN
jgi:hypothetical protein